MDYSYKGMMNFSLICRTCLKKANAKEVFSTQQDLGKPDEDAKISLALKFLVPDLYLGVSSNPVICLDCKVSLRIAYYFKKKCLETEKFVGNYLRKVCSTGKTISLHDVLTYKESGVTVIANQDDKVSKLRTDEDDEKGTKDKNVDVKKGKSLTFCEETGLFVDGEGNYFNAHGQLIDHSQMQAERANIDEKIEKLFEISSVFSLSEECNETEDRLGVENGEKKADEKTDTASIPRITLASKEKLFGTKAGSQEPPKSPKENANKRNYIEVDVTETSKEGVVEKKMKVLNKNILNRIKQGLESPATTTKEAETMSVASQSGPSRCLIDVPLMEEETPLICKPREELKKFANLLHVYGKSKGKLIVKHGQGPTQSSEENNIKGIIDNLKYDETSQYIDVPEFVHINQCTLNDIKDVQQPPNVSTSSVKDESKPSAILSTYMEKTDEGRPQLIPRGNLRVKVQSRRAKRSTKISPAIGDRENNNSEQSNNESMDSLNFALTNSNRQLTLKAADIRMMREYVLKQQIKNNESTENLWPDGFEIDNDEQPCATSNDCSTMSSTRSLMSAEKVKKVEPSCGESSDSDSTMSVVRVLKSAKLSEKVRPCSQSTDPKRNTLKLKPVYKGKMLGPYWRSRQVLFNDNYDESTDTDTEMRSLEQTSYPTQNYDNNDSPTLSSTGQVVSYKNVKRRVRSRIKIVQVTSLSTEPSFKSVEAFALDGTYMKDHDYLESLYKTEKLLVEKESETLFLCYICGITHPSDCHEDHMSRHQSLCKLCNMICLTPYNLNIHAKKHTVDCGPCKMKVPYFFVEEHHLLHNQGSSSRKIKAKKACGDISPQKQEDDDSSDEISLSQLSERMSKSKTEFKDEKTHSTRSRNGKAELKKNECITEKTAAECNERVLRSKVIKLEKTDVNVKQDEANNGGDEGHKVHADS